MNKVSGEVYKDDDSTNTARNGDDDSNAGNGPGHWDKEAK